MTRPIHPAYLPVLESFLGIPVGGGKPNYGCWVIPQAMAYAAIAGLPVQVGLYTALVPMLIYALLGTSRPLSVSTA